MTAPSAIPRLRRLFRGVALGLLVGLLVPACGGRATLVTQGNAMGTTYTIKVLWTGLPGPSKQRYSDAITAAVAAIHEADTTLSLYNSSSELARFNAHAATTPFPVSAVTLEAVEKAQEVSKSTGGAFDVTVSPLVSAWGFGPNKRRDAAPPSEAEIAALRERIGYEKLVADHAASTLQKTDPDVACDLGGIAQGYGVDRAAAALEAAGIVDYMVELGGEVRTRGVNSQGMPWRIAIEKPDPAGRAIETTIALSGKSISTSGDYRNYYERDGKRISHTIDPRSGRPIEHNLASVSVIHAECAMADAYATALMVLGPQEGLSLAEQAGLSALFIVRNPNGNYDLKTTSAYRREAGEPDPSSRANRP